MGMRNDTRVRSQFRTRPTLLITLMVAAAAGGLAAPPALAATARRMANAKQSDLADIARTLPVRGALRIEGVPFDGATTALELERFEAFAPDAQVIVAGDGQEVVLPPPDNAYYRGAVEGDLGAVAVLTASRTGEVRGLIVKNGVPWIINENEPKGHGQGLSTRRVDLGRPFADHVFRCATDDSLRSPVPLGAAGAADAAATSADTALVNYTARVAVETDFEFFQLFGNETAATDYVGDLFAYASTLYEAEVNTSLVVSYLKLWTTSADPWTKTACDSGNTPGILSEFRTYWTQHNGAVSRTIAHMLSGKPTGCGQAYLGTLCNTSYGYGVSGNLFGNFNRANPGIVWDILVVSHEIGHNFNSPHTHCYNGIGGISAPVDQCYGSEPGCYAGPTSLPCSQGPGYGCGTIMSYCHLLSGGYSNITMTFGLGFPYGTSPGRVPTRMHDYVVATAGSFPSCLQYLPPGPTQTSTVTPTRTTPPTLTPSHPPTVTPTIPATSTPSVTRTVTSTAPSPASTFTSTPTPTLTSIPTVTVTTAHSSTPTQTATRTATLVPTSTATPLPVAQFAAAQDAWIDQSNTTQNHGRDNTLRVQGTTRRIRRSLVLFDLTALPPGSCVSSALLRLTLTNTQSKPRTYAVHRLTQGWTEGTGKARSGVTWNNRSATQSWTQPGGDFVPAPTATTATGTLSGVAIQWNVTADVAAFRAGTATNYGWLVKDANEGSGGEFRFASRENATAAARPRLEIAYSPCP
jgi:hypothetical protein